MKLLIGNKNYSSWSFRVWLAMKVAEIPFEEDLRPFDVENDYADFFEFSPTGKVPVLQHEGQTLWESLAILEYLAEAFPDRNLWPSDRQARAEARCVAHEMHAGFMALRSSCPMNVRRAPSPIKLDAATTKDIARIEAMWAERLDRSGGPFLFGAFTIADAMYAPVASRFQSYCIGELKSTQRYIQTLADLAPWKAWARDSVAERWVVEIDEV